jgi:membrane-bound serine protease (ClpP class)
MLDAWLVLALGLLLLVAEAHVPGGVLGALGVAALITSGFLFRDDGVEVPVAVIIVTALIVAAFVIFAGRKAFAAQRDEPVRTGWEELIGRQAEVREPLDPLGQVWISGALWKARASDGSPIGVGDRVRVESVDGLMLVVSPIGSAATERGE